MKNLTSDLLHHTSYIRLLTSYFLLLPSYLILRKGSIRTVLGLEQHRSALQAFQAVPLSGRNIHERPPGTMSIVSTIPKLSGSGVPSLCSFVYPYRYSSKCPLTHTTVSEVSLCRCIGIIVPGSSAFSIRWDCTSGEVRKS